jgi:hypothetical protein
MQIIHAFRREIASFFGRTNADVIEDFLIKQAAPKSKKLKRKPPVAPPNLTPLVSEPIPPVRFYLLGKEIGAYSMRMDPSGRSVIIVRAWSIDHAFDQLVVKWPECRRQWVLQSLSSTSKEVTSILKSAPSFDPGDIQRFHLDDRMLAV